VTTVDQSGDQVIDIRSIDKQIGCAFGSERKAIDNCDRLAACASDAIRAPARYLCMNDHAAALTHSRTLK
jgi:hypothetical protein